jgi:hypothetical protein
MLTIAVDPTDHCYCRCCCCHTLHNNRYRYCDDGTATDPFFRSVMAYGCAGSTRVPWFSSPNLQYLGKATGTPAADNLRVLQQTHVSVANFRVSPPANVPAPAPAPPAPVPVPPPPTPAPTPQPTRKFCLTVFSFLKSCV